MARRGHGLLRLVCFGGMATIRFGDPATVTPDRRAWLCASVVTAVLLVALPMRASSRDSCTAEQRNRNAIGRKKALDGDRHNARASS